MRIEILIILTIIIIWLSLDSFLHVCKKEHQKYQIIIFIIYILLLIIVLFDRKQFDQKIYSDGLYIKTWLKLIFTNKIVFINVVGNIILFIPFGILIKHFKLKFIKSFIIISITILMIETLQYLTKRGVFDLLDIILNILGAVLGYFFVNRGEKNEGNYN